MIIDCTVEDGRVYEAGELMVGLHRTVSLVNTIAKGFNETTGENRELFGDGDLVLQNGYLCKIFAAHVDEGSDSSGKTVTNFEYSVHDHCNKTILRITKEKAEIEGETKCRRGCTGSLLRVRPTHRR